MAMPGARSACSSAPRALAAAAGVQLITVAQAQELPERSADVSTKGGDQFYDQISALHKAVRGSDPDGSLYWLARMLDGGCDPH